MRYGIFSDIQGNYRALERFFAETKSDVDQYLCLGDIVQNGTSYDDNRCIDTVIRKECLAVRGNHEDKVIADRALLPKKISPQNFEYLASLPLNHLFLNYFLVHAPLNQRVLTIEQAKEIFEQLPDFINICFLGHSHQPALFCEDEPGKIKKRELNHGVVYLKPDLRYLINPGGVGLCWGQPQTYMVYDDNTRYLHLRRL